MNDLKLIRKLWEIFHDLGNPSIFRTFLRKDDSVAYHNALSKRKNLIKELTDTLNDLQKISPNLNITEIFNNGKLLENGYDSLLKNMPVVFELNNDYNLKKQSVRISINFEEYRITKSQYIFIKYVKKKHRNKSFCFDTAMTELEMGFLYIADLFKRHTHIQEMLLEETGKKEYRLKVDIWKGNI